jgi:hypothetical protein
MRPTIKLLTASLLLMAMMSFQFIKTRLDVTVRNNLGNIEEGVKIQLFETEADYLAEKNVVAEGVTDKKGLFKFRELKEKAYYVIARKDDKDNSEGGEQIGKLEANKINKVTIIIQ